MAQQPSLQQVKAPTTAPADALQSVSTPQVSEPRTEPATKQTSEPALFKPRPKTQVALWIITREPRYTEERWDDGKFQGTPLSAFIEGISKFTQRPNIEKLKLTLTTPSSDTKITICEGAEGLWESTKKKFVQKLKEARAEAKAGPNKTASYDISYDIMVEPFYEQGDFLTSNVDEEDEDFDF